MTRNPKAAGPRLPQKASQEQERVLSSLENQPVSHLSSADSNRSPEEAARCFRADVLAVVREHLHASTERATSSLIVDLSDQMHRMAFDEAMKYWQSALNETSYEDHVKTLVKPLLDAEFMPLLYQVQVQEQELINLRKTLEKQEMNLRDLDGKLHELLVKQAAGSKAKVAKPVLEEAGDTTLGD